MPFCPVFRRTALFYRRNGPRLDFCKHERHVRTRKNRPDRAFHRHVPGSYSDAFQLRRTLHRRAGGRHQPDSHPGRRHARQLAGRRDHLLHWPPVQMGVDREALQGQARDARQAEEPHRQIRSMGSPAKLDTLRRRCDSDRSRILQDAGRVDSLPHARRKVRPLCNLHAAGYMVMP